MSKWEYFCDVSYYHYWAVREIGSSAMDESIHVMTEPEAKFICDKFNKLAELEAMVERQ